VHLGAQPPGDVARPVGGVVDDDDLVDRALLDERDEPLEDRTDRRGLVAGRQADGDGPLACRGESGRREL
jgi:hypothetical protein